MDLQCILCIANSSYTVKTPKHEVTFNTYWNFYKKLKILTCFPQNSRFRDQTGEREITSQNGSLPFKPGGLEHMKTQDISYAKVILWYFKVCIIRYIMDLREKFKYNIKAVYFFRRYDN